VIVYGRNAVREALRGRRAATVAWILAGEDVAREPWLATRSVRIGSPEAIERACGSREHQGICAELAGYPYVSARELLAGAEPLIVALDEVQDPQNLGAICRTAECAGATGVVICERRAAEVTPAVCRASAGAVEHLRIARARNLADFLLEARRSDCWCYGAATAPRALPYTEPDYRGGVVVVFGAEGHGLRRRVADCCDALVALPLRGRISSLNVNAAAGALLYEVLRRRTDP
jgi:23S rRNA (guanosine2251-2'-O)-methyltransferase